MKKDFCDEICDVGGIWKVAAMTAYGAKISYWHFVHAVRIWFPKLHIWFKKTSYSFRQAVGPCYSVSLFCVLFAQNSDTFVKF